MLTNPGCKLFSVGMAQIRKERRYRLRGMAPGMLLFGFQLPGLGSTRLQELEWQLHTVLFTMWLGYAYLKNAHVRIDVFVGGSPAGDRLALRYFEARLGPETAVLATGCRVVCAFVNDILDRSVLEALKQPGPGRPIRRIIPAVLVERGSVAPPAAG